MILLRSKDLTKSVFQEQASQASARLLGARWRRLIPVPLFRSLELSTLLQEAGSPARRQPAETLEAVLPSTVTSSWLSSGPRDPQVSGTAELVCPSAALENSLWSASHCCSTACRVLVSVLREVSLQCRHLIAFWAS